jgi:hypothetical protein
MDGFFGCFVSVNQYKELFGSFFNGLDDITGVIPLQMPHSFGVQPEVQGKFSLWRSYFKYISGFKFVLQTESTTRYCFYCNSPLSGEEQIE